MKTALSRVPSFVFGKGFTLVEMVVTVAMVALLATIVLPMAEVAVQRSKEQELRMSLRQIREAVDAYKLAGDEGRIERKVSESGYPKTLNVLVDGVEDIKSPKRTKMFFMRKIPRNPFFRDPTTPPQLTWGLRSYSSTDDDPKEGDDVYDVFAQSTGVGLNGVPYKSW